MKRFIGIEDEIQEQVGVLLHRFLPMVEQELKSTTGDTKAKIKLEVIFDDDEKEGLQMIVTAKADLPKQDGHLVKLSWNRGQLALFGVPADPKPKDIPQEELTDAERALETKVGEGGGEPDEGETEGEGDL